MISIMVEDVIIAGTGPAGFTTAIYAGRANLSPLVIEGAQPGGQLMSTTEVENFPGFVAGIHGPELMDIMRQQAQRFGARFRAGMVKSVDLTKTPFSVHLEDETLECLSFIVATGASARLLGLPAEQKLMGYGVSACAVCDGFFFRDKRVIVVGGGDSALEEAVFLTKFARRVYVVHRRDALRATKIMQDRAFRNNKIEFIWNSVVEDIHDVDQKKVTAVKLLNLVTDEPTLMEIDGVFMAIGHVPNSGFLHGQVMLNAQGYILCQGVSSRTSVEGVFACGDVMDPIYRQAITAAGTGCRAAIDCDHYIQSRKERPPAPAHNGAARRPEDSLSETSAG
jgi:thioredoxin reductase (NADPH)